MLLPEPMHEFVQCMLGVRVLHFAEAVKSTQLRVAGARFRCHTLTNSTHGMYVTMHACHMQ